MNLSRHINIHCIFRILCLFLALGFPACSEDPDKLAASGTDQLQGIDEKDWAPTVFPYLICEPSQKDGQGIATIAPSGPFTVTSSNNIEITFTVGEDGVDAGGFVMLQVSPWWGWSQPQTLDPQRPGYTAARTSFVDPSFVVRTLSLNRILVFSTKRAFLPGDTITFSYGNGPLVDKFAEAEELFQIFVDADGDGHSACIAEPSAVRIVAEDAVRLNVTVPSQVVTGDEIHVMATPLDILGNWSRFPEGEYTATVIRDENVSDGIVTVAEGGEQNLIFDFTCRGAGIYFVEVAGPSGLHGRSNVMLCQESPPSLKLYFGDIHGHSRMSDGSGTPEDYYRYARTVSGLDVAALTDHADFGTIPVQGMVWERIKKAANEAYEPFRFVTFLGFEWTNWEYGHRNVYYRDGSGPIFRSIDADADTPQELWNLIASHEAMTVAHHVGGGPIATNWDVVPGPKEWLVEISSIHGSSEYYGGEACIYSPVKGSFVRDALLRGYKLGIIGSGDTHDGHPGQRSTGAAVTGLVGIYSHELTREAVWEAFRKRHVYGTSGPKIILNFRVADTPMGSETVWPASKGAVPIGLRAVCCDDIESVEIIRNGETVFVEKRKGVFAQFLAEDTDLPVGNYWYYARILQKDGNMAWSSPVWVTVKR